MTRPWTILQGDCAATLATLPEESIDACVTDTPYGLSTILDPPNLSREALWSKLTSSAKEPTIKTLLRSWLDTGDNPKMSGRGFMGKEWDALVPSPNTWRAVWRVLKPGAYLFAFGGTRTFDLISLSLRLADFEVEDCLSWLYAAGFPKRVRLDLKIDQHFGKTGERPVAGRSSRNVPACDLALQPDDDTMSARTMRGMFVTGPATPDAARFVGWDRALRPGWEPIIVAVKPLRGTVAENALAYGTGGLHVDACRLPRGDIPDSTRPVGSRPMFAGMDHHEREAWSANPLGGYPANVAMDEDVAEELDRMSGVRVSGSRAAGVRKGIGYGSNTTGDGGPAIVGSEGGASRFFYVAKASSSERDAGLDDLPSLSAGERSDREDGTAGINGYAGTRGEGGHNPHPTVKPVSLMRWLCRLAAPPGAHDPDMAKRPVILDPFFGSGSTGVAALAEGLCVVGCEMMPEYVEVARRRLQHAHALAPDDPEAPVRRPDAPGQRSLF